MASLRPIRANGTADDRHVCYYESGVYKTGLSYTISSRWVTAAAVAIAAGCRQTADALAGAEDTVGALEAALAVGYHVATLQLDLSLPWTLTRKLAVKAASDFYSPLADIN